MLALLLRSKRRQFCAIVLDDRSGRAESVPTVASNAVPTRSLEGSQKLVPANRFRWETVRELNAQPGGFLTNVPNFG